MLGFKVHLAPKYNCSLNKSLYFVKLIGERIFRFGRIIDILRPVEVEKHLVKVCAKESWGELCCDVERRTSNECLLVLFTVSCYLVEFSTLRRSSHLTALHDRQRCLCKKKLTGLHDSYSSWHLYICLFLFGLTTFL